MNDEYLSIPEFARRAGVSRQAVYKQLSTGLQKYVNLVNGRKVIDSKALMEVFGVGAVNQCQPDCQPCQPDCQPENQGLNQEIKHLQERLKDKDQLIDLLQEQIQEKKEELRAKDQQIKELHSLLDQQQKLNAIDRQKIFELEDKQQQEIQEKKSFFARLFKL